MALFGRKGQPEHDAAVIYVFRKRILFPRTRSMAYYSAVCRCGWHVRPVDAEYPDPACEKQMAAAALAHDPAADTTLSFPLDDPRRG